MQQVHNYNLLKVAHTGPHECRTCNPLVMNPILCHWFKYKLVKSISYLHCVSKKSSHLATCQILNNFQNFCTAGRHTKCATNPNPPYLKHVARLPWKLKIPVYSINMEENANKLHYKKLPTFESRLSTSLLCTPLNTNVSSKSCIRG